MFVQVIQGRVSDASRLKAQLDRWIAELQPGAVGWLGSTAGVTEDGQGVLVARFESDEAARQNGDRPEQSSWWEETARCFDDEPRFWNSTRVEVETPGDPSQAQFVQVMRGRTSDPERARELMSGDTTDWQSFRPDMLGSVSVEHEGGEWTMVLYFTSEAEAREGEKKQPPPEMEKMMQEMATLAVGEPTYLDLKDPWLAAPS